MPGKLSSLLYDSSENKDYITDFKDGIYAANAENVYGKIDYK